MNTNTLYDPTDVGKNYAPRIADFIARGLANKTKTTSHNDRQKVMLLIVDAQVDFVHSDGNLSVPGALDDTRRLIEFIYKNLSQITDITASLDTHYPHQIFFPTWWKGSDGKNPAPYTTITYGDVRSGKWIPVIDPLWSVDYVKKLESLAKKSLMVWPFHVMQGTAGNNLVPALSEAIFYHSAARTNQPTFLTKGTVPQVEHYGIFKAEVEYPGNVNSLLNTQILNKIAGHDLIYVAGEAKSHCVLETMKQLVEYFGAIAPDAVKKIRFLMDCTSSVQAPGIDFDAIADIELQGMVQKGIMLVKSTDPIR